MNENLFEQVLWWSSYIEMFRIELFFIIIKPDRPRVKGETFHKPQFDSIRRRRHNCKHIYFWLLIVVTHHSRVDDIERRGLMATSDGWS